MGPCGLLQQSLGQGHGAGKAVEESWDQVAHANGDHLLVGTDGVAMLFAKDFCQGDGHSKANNSNGQGIDCQAGERLCIWQSGLPVTSGDSPTNSRLVLES